MSDDLNTKRIARLPSVTQSPANPDTAAAFDMIRARGGKILNLHLILGHAGKIYRARQELTYALRFDAVSPRKIRELAILRAAHMSTADYEWAQHVPMALANGYRQEHIDALADDWSRSQLFDEKERALLAFIDQLIGRQGQVDDGVFSRLAAFFTPQEIVELAITATHYVQTGTLSRAFQIQLEDGKAQPKR